MSDASPTRSAVIELKDERRAMHEGYVFLDEKCLLLAGEMLRQLALHARLQRESQALHATARSALEAAVERHGLHELQVYPAADTGATRFTIRSTFLMGVRLQSCEFSNPSPAPPEAVNASPEAEACRRAFAAVVAAAAPLAAVAGNLERLSVEYRRSVRRARALQDVMLPELEHSIADIEGRLEELEQEDAIGMRRGAASPAAQ